MTSIRDKANYVRGKMWRNDRFDHECHWPGCSRKVAPALWGCKAHWSRLPQALKNKIWGTYRPGQEITKTPSREYVAVAREVQTWIENNVPPLQRGLEYDL